MNIKIVISNLIICIVIIIMTSACSKINDNETVPNDSNADLKEETNSKKNNLQDTIIESKKSQVAVELMKDFKKYFSEAESYIERKNSENIVDKYEKDKIFRSSLHSLVLASEKLNAILGPYSKYFDDSKLSWVYDKKEIIDRNMGSFSTIYTGYSKSGIKFIALASPTMTGNFDYNSVVHSIRKDKNEPQFLSAVITHSHKTNYYAIDLYMEDLIGEREHCQIELLLYDDNVIQRPIKEVKDEELKRLLLDHSRKYSKNNIIKNKEWKLFLFENKVSWPEIRIIHEGEEIILKN